MTVCLSRTVAVFQLALLVGLLSACSSGPLPQEHFAAAIEGGQVVVRVKDADVYATQCTFTRGKLEKDVQGAWVALQDDRPPRLRNPGYFLDGQYVEPAAAMCEAYACEKLTSPIAIGDAREYVKTGTRAKPSAGQGMADVLETRPISGELLVTFRYSSSASCEGPHEVALKVSAP